MAKTTTIEEKIAKAVTTTGMSATALAKKLGYTKASQIMNALQSEVNSGSVKVDTTGRFALYSKGEKTAVAKKAASNSKTTVVEGEKPKNDLPEATLREMAGYSVANIKYKGKAMRKVSTPDGRKIRIGTDEKLMVINGDPKYVVKTAEDSIKAIQKFALANNMTTFTVNDIKMNKKVTNDKDIEVKDDHIIFLSIRKHNKAAA
jgi:hypothetical protein